MRLWLGTTDVVLQQIPANQMYEMALSLGPKWLWLEVATRCSGRDVGCHTLGQAASICGGPLPAL